MKKIIISMSVVISLAGAAVVSAVVIKRNSNDILNQNVEALMQQEHASGKCEEREYDCVGYCLDCGALVYAANHKGPAYDIKH